MTARFREEVGEVEGLQVFQGRMVLGGYERRTDQAGKRGGVNCCFAS